MRMHLHTVRRTHLVSAPVPRLSRQGDASKGMLYGRYIVRYKADPVPGYKVAWLLWPDSDNWSDGEIDFPEGNLDGTTSAFVHHKGSPRVQNAYLTTATFTTWHTAEIEWTRAYIRFVLDGIVVGLSTDTAHIPGVPMHWVLQTETAVGKAAPADSSSGNVYIDWAVAYAAAR
jgi:beta-glucanase (GH16 family)